MRKATLHPTRKNIKSFNKYMEIFDTFNVHVPCYLLLNSLCVGLSKQVEHSAAEVVRVAVWIAQLIGYRIQE